MTPRSRRMLFSRGIHLFPALSELRAQGMPGGRCARGLVCNGSGRAHTSIQVTPESPGIPHAMVYGLYRALPGARALWPPSPLRSLLLKNLTPASRCQDHTTSHVRVRHRRLQHHPRPPHPAPRFVTLRNAPLSGRDDENIALICTSENQNIFSGGAGQGGQINAWGANCFARRVKSQGGN